VDQIQIFAFRKINYKEVNIVKFSFKVRRKVSFLMQVKL